MPIETLDVDGFLKFLKEKQGDQPNAQYAQSLGITPSYLCDVYNNRTLPGDKILNGLSAMNVAVTRSSVYQVETSPTKKEKK